MLQVKEKILLYGGSNSGKTHAALRFATEIVAADHRVYVIDADDGVSKLIAEMDDFSLLREAEATGNFRIETVYDWNDCMEAVALYRHQFKPVRGDLVIFEMINFAWDWSQVRFVDAVKDTSISELQLQKAEHGRLQFGGLDGRSEWPIIKKLYADITTPTLQSPAHVIWTAASKPVIRDNERPENMEMYGGAGWKPEGIKDLQYKVDTIFHLMVDYRTHGRSYSTLKERGNRTTQTNVQYRDLFSEYYNGFGLTLPWSK